jgi:DNA (cytosine-5)-methyltransferase 1
MNKTVAEFFAGIGLMRLGLEQAGWNVVWANDIDPDKKRMYQGHFLDDKAHFHLGDVHELNASTVPRVALATASFPCTDLSLAGARKGLAGEHSGAFWGFIEVLRAMRAKRPPIVLLENVTGFLTSHDGEDFRRACIALNELDYEVDALILDAACFVPQSRQRLFVIGRKPAKPGDSLRESKSFFEGPCRPSALADFILWHPEIRWNMRQLPKPPPIGQNKLESILEILSPNSALWWSSDRAAYLLGQMSTKHRAEANRMIEGEKISFGTIFRRVRNGKSMAELRTDGIAGCLRTPRGGSGRQILFTAGKGGYRVRLLSPRECARLMGADKFRIGPDITLNQALFGFGDAVCVPAVSWLTKNYLDPVFEEVISQSIVPSKPAKSVRYG